MAYEFHKASVLIVEDNKPMVELIKSVINMFGFKEIYTATDGSEGFDVFCDRRPDLVISDWMMSPTNGIEMAHMIRQDERSPNKYVPIILLTGFSQKQRVIEARDMGITEFIVKPFKVIDLYKRIENIIEAPRKFVDTASFFGPDRRRKKNIEFAGPLRREDDRQDTRNQDIITEDEMYKSLIKKQKEQEELARKYNDPLVIDFVERENE
jgi:DNA-binding response OmpR family regulator